MFSVSLQSLHEDEPTETKTHTNTHRSPEKGKCHPAANLQQERSVLLLSHQGQMMTS